MTKNKRKYVFFEDEIDCLDYDLEIIYNQDFILNIINNVFNLSNIEKLKFLVKLRLIKNRMVCSDCGNYMNLVKFKSIDGFVWRCNQNSKKIQTSIRAFSFFDNIRKSLKQIFLFIYYWSKQENLIETNRELGLNKNICTEWSYILREFCQPIFIHSNIEIGGVDQDGTPKIVEIDEYLFFRRKYNRGRYGNQTLGFGYG
jgi:hypothetical protein